LPLYTIVSYAYLVYYTYTIVWNVPGNCMTQPWFHPLSMCHFVGLACFLWPNWTASSNTQTSKYAQQSFTVTIAKLEGDIVTHLSWPSPVRERFPTPGYWSSWQAVARDAQEMRDFLELGPKVRVYDWFVGPIIRCPAPRAGIHFASKLVLIDCFL